MILIRRIAALLLALTPSCFAQSPTVTVVHEGTLVSLALVGTLNSRTAKVGDHVDLMLVSDVTANGAVVAKEGAEVSGSVTFVKRAALAGRSGQINLRLDALRVRDKDVRLSGSKDKNAASDVQFSRAYHLKWPMGLMRTGDDVEINSGTQLTVYVSEDIALSIGN